MHGTTSTVAIARWVGAVDQQQLQDALDGKLSDDPDALIPDQPEPATSTVGARLARIGDAHASLLH